MFHTGEIDLHCGSTTSIMDEMYLVSNDNAHLTQEIVFIAHQRIEFFARCNDNVRFIQRYSFAGSVSNRHAHQKSETIPGLAQFFDLFRCESLEWNQIECTTSG